MMVNDDKLNGFEQFGPNSIPYHAVATESTSSRRALWFSREFRPPLEHHSFKLVKFRRFPRILMCRLVGHQLSDQPDHLWCPRCGLAYEEIYWRFARNPLYRCYVAKSDGTTFKYIGYAGVWLDESEKFSTEMFNLLDVDLEISSDDKREQGRKFGSWPT